MITTRRAAGLNLILLAALAGCTARSSVPAQEPAARSGTTSDSLAAMVPLEQPPAALTDALPADPAADNFLESGRAFSGPDIASEANLTTLARRIALEYKQLNRLTSDPMEAPFSCIGPRFPTGAVVSASNDESTHGKKYYFMHANALSSYWIYFERGNVVFPDGRPEFPVGSIIVKQTFSQHRAWYPEDFNGLFMMFKVDEKSARTDEGWIYATVAPDLKTVTSVGVVESCAACHRESTNERIIGR
jgi:hypothetical protein